MDSKSNVADDSAMAALSDLTLEDDHPGHFIDIPDPEECLVMMPCGIVKRPEGVPTYLTQYEQGRKRDERRYRRRLLPGEKRGDCICEYYDFSALRKEREEDTSHVKQLFPFTRLPVELQVKVFKHMFTCDYLEFCPGRDHYGYFGVGDTAYKNQQDSLRDKIQGFGKFLRANRSIHAEASKILYRNNEFRFTSVTGWDGLDRLILKIGMDGCKLLRRICHPGFMPFSQSPNTESLFFQGIIFNFLRGYETRGTFYTRSWFDAEKFSPDPVLVLEKLGGLEKLCPVLPPDCNRIVASPFDQTKFSNLTTTFASVKQVCEISIYDHYLKREVSHPTDPSIRSVNGKGFAQETFVREGNPKWFWEKIETDGSGKYEHPTGSQDDPNPMVEEVVEDEDGDQQQ